MKKWISSLIIGAAATVMGSSNCQAQPGNLDDILSLSVLTSHTYNSQEDFLKTNFFFVPLISNDTFPSFTYDLAYPSEEILEDDKINLDYCFSSSKPNPYDYLSKLQLGSTSNNWENTRKSEDDEFKSETDELQKLPDLNLQQRLEFPSYADVSQESNFKLDQIIFDISRSQKAKYNKIKQKSNQFWKFDSRNVYVDLVSHKYGFENIGFPQDEINHDTSDAFDPVIYVNVAKEIIARLADNKNRPAIWIYRKIMQIEKAGKILENLRDALQEIYIIDLTRPLDDLSNPFSEIERFIEVPHKYKKQKLDIDATIEPAINEHRIGRKTFSDVYRNLTEGKDIRYGLLLNIEIKF